MSRRTIELGDGRTLSTQSTKRWLVITDNGDTATVTARRDERSRALAAWREAERAQPGARVLLYDTSTSSIERDTAGVNDATPNGATTHPGKPLPGLTPVQVEYDGLSRLIAEAKTMGAHVTVTITITP